MSNITIVPLATRTVDGTQSFNGWSPALPIYVQLNTSNASGASLSLTVFIECSLDNGATWAAVGPGLSASGNTTVRKAMYADPVYMHSNLLRVRWDVSGSFDFEVFVTSNP